MDTMRGSGFGRVTRSNHDRHVWMILKVQEDGVRVVPKLDLRVADGLMIP
jgi:hypothetical protein